MKIWDDKWLTRMREMMVTIEAATRYMDDGRTAMYAFKHGWRWVEGTIIYKKCWEIEDQPLSRTEVTRRIILKGDPLA